jgi:UDP-GlcNAc:undecaprenyl-phosphate GlcNAc-1-phosphate transferase
VFFPILFFLFIGALSSWLVIRILLLSGVGQGQTANIQHHHTHIGIIPRIGGLGLVAGFLVSFIICAVYLQPEVDLSSPYWGLIFGGIAAFLLGIVDDFYPLGAKLKLLFQIAIAVLAYQFGLEIKTVVIPFTEHSIELGSISYILTVGWFVVLMNLINLIDGLDGLAGGIGLMLMGLLAYLAFNHAISLPFFLAVGMVGALFGFLIHNFPPAKVYMGDSGAYLIGFIIAALSIINSEKGTILAAMIAPLIALAVPIADVVFALIRRGVKGLPLFRPDSRHIHHRIQNAGFSRRGSVLLLYSISLFALICGLLVFVDRGRHLGLFMGFAFVVILITLRGQKITATSIQMLLSESLQARQETRNALYLKDWFVVEAERADTGAHLWLDYHFILKKMGFCRVEMQFNKVTRSFYVPRTGYLSLDLLHCYQHVFKNYKDGTLTLYAEKEFLSERQFDLMCDIAVEAWMKASDKWSQIHVMPLDFEAVANADGDYKSQNNRNLYRPTY